MVDWRTLVLTNFDYLLAIAVLVVGFVAGYLVGRVNERVLRAIGVQDAVEGTSVERTARRFGTSVVSLIARFTSWIVYVVAIVLALAVTRLVDLRALWYRVVGYAPAVAFAAAVLAFSFLVGDKAEIVVAERLRGVKIPEIGVIPVAVKYAIVFVAALVALGQLGVATLPLLVVFTAVVFGAVVFALIATKDLLTSAAAGAYVLLNQPYGIGDEIRVAENQGIVQEVDLFVTRVENDGEEFIIPNHVVMRNGAVRVRN